MQYSDDDDYDYYRICPGCGAGLDDTHGQDAVTGTFYWGVECPNGCDLWEFWG